MVGIAGKIIATVTVLTIIFLPVAAGAVSVPDSIYSNALGHFLASWINYWLSLLRTLLSELTSADILNFLLKGGV